MAQSHDPQGGDVSPNGAATPPPKDPHLLDLADFAEIVQWLFLVVASGVAYDLMKMAAVELLKTLQKQKGRNHVRQLREGVMERAAKAREEIDDEAAQRIRELFEDFT
jgi:hypothetical protein